MIRGRSLFVENNLERRDFLKLSTKLVTVLGLSPILIPKLTSALESPLKPPVIWLHFQECTGCSESLLRSEGPDLAELILDTISLEYHETLFAAAGQQIEDQLQSAMKRYKGRYVLVVEGAIPTKNDGWYCSISGKTAKSLLEEVAADAAAVVSIGSCASWGGIPSSGSNPTGATGAGEILKMAGGDLAVKPVVTVPGCPPSPHNFLSTVVHYIAFGKLPALDAKGRPKFAYGRLIHDQCERRSHFDSGRFALEFGDEGHRKGYCLFKLGCKGPSTYGNCPEIGFNREKSWPVSIGHPCFGCNEQGVGYTIPLHTRSEVTQHNPPQQYALPTDPANIGVETGAAALLGAVAGGAVVAGVMKTKSLPKREEE